MDLNHINKVAPEHCKTSCSDEHAINGRYSADDHGGCYRCTLIDAARVPDGYKLVPIEPTIEMLGEIRLIEHFTDAAMVTRYKAMIAVAPQPTTEKDDAND